MSVYYFIGGVLLGAAVSYYLTKRGCVSKVEGVASKAITGIGLNPATGLGATISNFVNGQIEGSSTWGS